MFWNKYPYTDFHELNLDMILRMMRDLTKEWNEFEALNKITFSGEWDITKQYPAWTIVNDNNGRDGYISIQPVPAGVTINNVDYWRAVANYSDIIADLQNRVIALEAADVSLDQRLDKVEDILKYPKHQILMFGDSWVDKVNTTYGHFVPEAVEYCTGMTVLDYAHAGTGFDVPNGYDAQIEVMAADPNVDFSEVKCVVLVAFMNEYNDGTSADDFALKLQDWVDKVRVYTDAPIYWFMNYSCQNSSSTPLDTHFYPQRDYFQRVMSTVSRDIKCVPTFGWVEFSAINNHWQADYYHPDMQGSILYGRNIARVIEGLAPEVYEYCYVYAEWGATYGNCDIEFYTDHEGLYYRTTTPNSAASVGGGTSTLSHPLPAKLKNANVIAPNIYMGQTGNTAICDPNIVTTQHVGNVTCDGMLALPF